MTCVYMYYEHPLRCLWSCTCMLGFKPGTNGRVAYLTYQSRPSSRFLQQSSVTGSSWLTYPTPNDEFSSSWGVGDWIALSYVIHLPALFCTFENFGSCTWCLSLSFPPLPVWYSSVWSWSFWTLKDAFAEVQSIIIMVGSMALCRQVWCWRSEESYILI
jgi:hypothetical protein